MSKFELRPYQKEAISAVLTARKRGVQRLLLCLPTGAGKTVIFAHLAQMARRGVLVLAHRSELLLQAQEKIQRGLPPEIQVAIEAGEQKAPAEAKIVLCSIRSLREERLQQLLQGRDIGLVIYDECHHATAEDNLRVLTQIGVFQKQWQGTLLGVTATTSRADGIGLGRVFEEIVYSRSLTQMVEEGYLAPLKGYRITTQTPLPALSDQGQDFDPEELAEVVDVEDRNALIARTLQEFARDRRILVFCVNVNHAFHLSKALNHLSIPTKTVHGMMPALERADTLKRFAIANLQAITNVAVLTEGFDDPGVSCIAMARPTRSSALYLQCIGRGMRLAPGKKECIILDFVDLSLLEIVTLPTLFGMPRHLKLQGEDVLEAEKTFRKFLFDYPGFEIEAGEITLETLQKNAAQFNPLTLEVQEDVLALSLNAWISLEAAALSCISIGKKTNSAPSPF
jgi:ATP-dependent helicase IRC3